MEYRRRRQRAYQQTDIGAWRSYAVVAIVFLAVVYLVGVSKLGTWLANSLVAPAWKRAQAAMNPAEPTEPIDEEIIVLATRDTLTKTIDFPSVSCYALQIGVYADIENAKRQSEALQKLGAAGYILEDAGRYRVLAAGYPDQADMDTVRKQLSEGGVASTRHVLSSPNRTWTAESTREQLAVLTAAANALPSMLDRLYRLAIEFDRDGLSIEVATQSLHKLSAELTRHTTDIAALSATDAETEALNETLTVILQAMDTLAASDGADTPRFSAGLKRLYLQAVETYLAFTSGVM